MLLDDWSTPFEDPMTDFAVRWSVIQESSFNEGEENHLVLRLIIITGS